MDNCIFIFCFTQFLDGSSNLKQDARRMSSMMHWIPFTCHVFIIATVIFYVKFFILVR